MENYKIKANDLDRTTGMGATRYEMAYSKERSHLWLKAKYRPKRASRPQWGTGGDYSGRATPKAGRRGNLPPQPKKVMLVGPTGRKTMTWED